MIKRAVVIGILVVLLLPLTLGSAPAPDRALTGQETTTFTLPGLDGNVTIRYDELGVPHIYATTTHDLVMAQGFVHAADRWWQMEWFRHQGSGRLSELAGSSLLEADTFLRTLGLERNARRDLAALPDDVLALLQAYADGVNAWLDGKTPDKAALEYIYLNQLIKGAGGDPITEIEPWTPLNSATWLQVMALGLNGNFYYELMRMRALEELTPEQLALVAPGYDYAHMPIITQPGWTPAAVTAQKTTVPPFARIPGLETLALLNTVGLGSNNWVVGGERTESGQPLLANDPHLGIQMPSIWYENSLHCVEISDACPYDVSGYSFPGAPFVVLGHNARIGWGATNVGTDVQDLYRIEINPDNPLQYRYEGEWVDMEVITETIRAWDAEPVELQIRMTRFGPLVHDLFEVDQPLALRWGAADTTRSFLALMLLNKAANWEDFQEALSYFDLPGQNFIYADVDGNIGYLMTGRVPIRAEGHDGSLPVDGTTNKFEWQGYVDPAQNPRLYNPDTHYIVTANNAVVTPDEFPYTITVDWEFGYRAARIETLIQSYEQHSPDTFAAIQADAFNWSASLLIPFLADMDLGDEALNEAVAWLAEWDYQNTADSPHAALYNAFWREVVRLVFEELPAYEESYATYLLSKMVTDEQHPVWQNKALGESDPAALLRLALERALSFMEETYGSDRAAWRWGDLHMARFLAAPLGQLPYGLDPTLDKLLPILFNVFNREVGVPGGPAIVNATSWDPTSDSFDVSSLPSMRMILDFSDFDNSRFVHTTGQSGVPSSPHYDDMIDLWAAGQYHPHYFTPEAVEAHTAAIWTLKAE